MVTIDITIKRTFLIFKKDRSTKSWQGLVILLPLHYHYYMLMATFPVAFSYKRSSVAQCITEVTLHIGKAYLPAPICRVIRVWSTGACAGIFSKHVLLVIADITLKRVANYIYIPIYSTISRIPTTLKYSPLLLVTENGKVEIITNHQSPLE